MECGKGCSRRLGSLKRLGLAGVSCTKPLSSRLLSLGGEGDTIGGEGETIGGEGETIGGEGETIGGEKPPWGGLIRVGGVTGVKPCWGGGELIGVGGVDERTDMW